MKQEPESFRYKKVMIIDDNEIDRYVCEKASKKFHLSEEVIKAESAKDGLEYLSAHENEPSALPDLIFLDINMPEMNGFEFLEAYKELPEVVKRKCIIVMLTTSSHIEDKERANASSYVKGYLNKPLNEEKLRTL
jgi:CheY-like chemotaxis protein